ncbi:mitochondrial inner membrane protease ATP23 homolog isoform X2 [Mirounga angustirostris]|uniref:mitochondrial inner membrane protease ATP23 homolog isoform X2 n=1 Tax=Mirounga angustirostris TaxID=9716 RepID=UPI001E68B76F|nr:mitochondrial inner membrane protease ATP23 homolog isoform X2 [Mirounga angustirostris]
MAGAADERGPGSAAGEQLQQQHVACQVFPERLAQGKPGQGFLSSFFTNNQKCQLMLLKTLETNPYVKLLLDAMKHSGCAVNKERHFSCEDCNGNVSGGFDASTSQIVLCQNNIRNQAHMNRVVTHELVHAFDHCRAHVNWFTDVRHLACSEVRAANLSGDCSLVNEIFRLHFGLKQHHQELKWTRTKNKDKLEYLTHVICHSIAEDAQGDLNWHPSLRPTISPSNGYGCFTKDAELPTCSKEHHTPASLLQHEY